MKKREVLSYVFVVQLIRDVEIRVGALGIVDFKSGYYMYVGSAKNGISRICRHFRKEKKLRWHIDYLTTSSYSKPVFAYLFKERECEIAKKLKLSYSYVPRFGCSDCACESHLFYSKVLPCFDGFFGVLRPEDCNSTL